MARRNMDGASFANVIPDRENDVLDVGESRRSEDGLAAQQAIELLARFMREGAAAADLDHLLELIATYTGHLLKADYAGLALGETDHGMVSYYGLYGHLSETNRYIRLPALRCPGGHALAAGQTLLLEHLDAHPAYPRDDVPVHRDEAGLTVVAIPLLSRTQGFGAIEVGWRKAITLDPLHVQLAEIVGGYASSLLGQARARREAQEAVTRRTLYDALTGLPNRALFFDRLQQAVLAAQRGLQPLALLLLDIDRFTEVNTALGHRKGDVLLHEIGVRLHEMLRTSDTVARLGGDEFAVLLPGSSGDGAVETARKLTAAFDGPFLVGEQNDLHVGVSIGIALCPDHGGEAQLLLRRADSALRAAKRTRSTLMLYSPAQEQQGTDRLALAGALRRAIECGQLMLHYQPKVEIGSGRICCVEALVRWRHPRHGVIPPDRFIPLAEQTGLIKPLTRWVLDMALRQTQLRLRSDPRFCVAVNLSMWNLHDPQLPDTIAHLLRTYQVPPSGLRVELTESTIMSDTERSVEVLARLAAMGIGISVDDFGTGYSSLTYLKRLPVDELKIDKSFVLQMAEDEKDAAIVRSTITLGHNLGLQVIAEGVENKETWERLAAQGCDGGQGYYLSRPLPAGELQHRLDAGWSYVDGSDVSSA